MFVFLLVVLLAVVSVFLAVVVAVVSVFLAVVVAAGVVVACWLLLFKWKLLLPTKGETKVKSQFMLRSWSKSGQSLSS